MRKQRKKKSAGRGKIVLIAVLGAVMIGVWGNALLGDGDKPAVARRAGPRSPRRARPAPVVAAATTAPARQPVADWPTIALTSAVLNDPFAKPAWAIERRAEEAPSSVSRTRGVSELAARERAAEQRASIVIIAGGNKVARVGDNEVRVGDFVGGFEVLDITRDGVVVANEPASR